MILVALVTGQREALTWRFTASSSSVNRRVLQSLRNALETSRPCSDAVRQSNQNGADFQDETCRLDWFKRCGTGDADKPADRAADFLNRPMEVLSRFVHMNHGSQALRLPAARYVGAQP